MCDLDNDDVGDDGLKAAAAATYAATADYFDAPALSFWDRFGTRTVERLHLTPGSRVLDACCGTGASVIPAARAVGHAGHVLGVDLSTPALSLAHAKAASARLSNVEFLVADVEEMDLPSESFDAVVCVFGIVFLPDMAAGLAELWRLVRPGGRLAVTVWGPRIFEPAASRFWAAVEEVRPDLAHEFEPWTRVTDPGALAGLFAAAGVPAPHIAAERGCHPVRRPEDWWTIILGTGFRATVERLTETDAERVRTQNLAAIADVCEVEANVVYAVSGETPA
jgi:SAM-dependent methyltransferase